MGLVHGILSALFPPQPEPIGDLREGRQVTVRGTVMARDLIASPLTGEAGVYYSYSVEEWRESRMAGLPEGLWRLAEHDEAIAEFYVMDDSGRAIVAPQRARIERGRGVRVDRVPLGTMLRRATELMVRPGDLVEVTGLAVRADDLYDEARGYRQKPTTAMLVAPPGDQIVIRLLAPTPRDVARAVGS